MNNSLPQQIIQESTQQQSQQLVQYEDSEEYDVADGHSSDEQATYENSASIEEVRCVFGVNSAGDDPASGSTFGAQIEDKGKSPEQLKSENDYYGLFLDPENEHIYYRKIFGRDDFIRIESLVSGEEEGQHDDHKTTSSNMSSSHKEHKLHCKYDDEKRLKQQFDRRNRHTLFLLREMLILENFSWTFQGEADSYRRRPFPLKFLHPECSDYPVYAFSSELSKAFDDSNGVPTFVDLSEFADQIDSHMGGGKASGDEKKQRSYSYEKDELSLVISTGEFINDIIREVFMKFKRFKLQPRNSEFKLALKVDGFREYFYGNYQLLQYERVRWCLRKKQKLKLILTEIRTDSKDPFFPPLFKMDKKIHYPIIHVKDYKYDMQLQKLKEWLEKQKNLEIKRQEREPEGSKAKANKGNLRMNQFTTKEERNNDAQLKAELEEEPPTDYALTNQEIQKVLQEKAYNKENDTIPFRLLENSSQYFWYSPVPNLFEERKELQEELKDLQNNHLSVNNEKPSIEVHNGLSKRDRIKMGWVDVPKEKNKISITKHRFQNGGTTAAKPNEQIVVESGECNWFFKFKIISIERINKIFEEIRKPIATDNKETVPKNVTLDWYYIKNKTKIEKKDIKQNKKKDQQDPDDRKSFMAHDDDHALDKSNNSNDSGNDSDQNEIRETATAHERLETNEGMDIVRKKEKDKADTYHFPKLINAAMKKYQANEVGHQCDQCKHEKEDDPMVRKIQKTYQSKNFKKLLKQTINIDEDLEKEFHNKYIPQQFSVIKQPFCNFSHGFHTMQAYKNILGFSVGNYTPTKIKIECTLYHGCEKLVEKQVIESNTWFSNNIQINKQTDFGKLRYCQLPVKTKLSINVILVFDKPGQDLTIGCVSTNLFDEKHKFKSGRQALNLWPFYQIDKRLGCMKEYKGREFIGKDSTGDSQEQKSKERQDIIKKIHNEFAQIILEFDSFIFPMVYSSRDLDQIQKWKYDKAQEDSLKLKKRLKEPWKTWNKVLPAPMNPQIQKSFQPPTTLQFGADTDERLKNLFKCDHSKEHHHHNNHNHHHHQKKNEDEGDQHQKKDQANQSQDQKSKEYLQLITINKDDEEDKKSMLQSNIVQINKNLAELKKIFQLNPLDDLNKKQKKILFKTREHYSSYPQGLPMFLRSVEWNRPLLVNETYKILKSWALMEPEEAICLLDAKYPDEQVRQYAVERISHLSDDDIALYMLQFTQALIYEEQHYSPLSDMLIERALKNPYVVGQSLFWALKSNLYLKTSYERFYLLLESFLMLCGKFRNELLIQIQVNNGLKVVQQNVMLDRYGFLEKREHPWTIKFHKDKRRESSRELQMDLSSKGRRSRSREQGSKRSSQSDSQKRLSTVQDANQQQQSEQQNQKSKKQQQENRFDRIKKNARKNLLEQRAKIMPIVFNLASDPKNIIKDFKYPKLTVFKSKKVPMLLTLLNSQKGGIDTRVMFKNGDDMRQDILTLQIIAIMDKMWLANKLNLRMTPYKVTGTDCMQGFLEFNENTDTLATMQYAGNMFPLVGRTSDRYNVFNTFSDSSIMEFFEKKARKRIEAELEQEGNEQTLSEEEIKVRVKAIIDEQRKVFAKSCAGYCVASYVLGLGDRHADNILINTIEGHFIHIDFGHFLCNYKKSKVFGYHLYQRETDPFVFTPEIAYFINGGPLKLKLKQKMKNLPQQSVQKIQKTQQKQTRAIKEKFTSRRKNSMHSSRTSSFTDQQSLENQFESNMMNAQSRPGFNNLSEMEPMLQYTQEQSDEIQQRIQQMRQTDSKVVRSDWTKSELFLEFEEDCCKAYNILRKNGDQLINLFLLMLSAGMPELNYESDIQPMVRRLSLDLTEQEASNLFKKEIVNAMNNRMRRMDNFFHNVKAKYM